MNALHLATQHAFLGTDHDTLRGHTSHGRKLAKDACLLGLEAERFAIAYGRERARLQGNARGPRRHRTSWAA